MKRLEKNNVVLLSSGQPSLNPRLVKEADALADAGYDVTVIYQFWNYWGTEMDEQLLPQKKWKAVRVGGSPKKNRILFWFGRLRQNITKSLIFMFGFNHHSAEMAAGRCVFLLLKEALRHPADLFIAHNLAALPAAVLAAKKRCVKCGFDAEDFHRNEVSNDPENPDVKLKIFLEEKYIPQTNYLTASSEPIRKLYQKLFPKKEFITILNVFPVANEVSMPFKKLVEPLKLFWFSQTIGLNRGLQDAFSAMKILENDHIELHILGFLSEEIDNGIKNFLCKLEFVKNPVIIFYPPVDPEKLPDFAAGFDVGLALEPGFCINNDAALSNKIFTYLQAGLAVAATGTTAQKQFLTENPNLGFCYEKGNAAQLAEIFKRFLDDPGLLRKTRQAAYQAARNQFNWEIEKEKFLQLIRKVLAEQ